MMEGHRTFQGGESSQKQNILKLNLNFQRGGPGQGQTKQPFTGRVWMFSGKTIISICYNLISFILNLYMDPCTCGHQFHCSFFAKSSERKQYVTVQ